MYDSHDINSVIDFRGHVPRTLQMRGLVFRVLRLDAIFLFLFHVHTDFTFTDLIIIAARL